MARLLTYNNAGDTAPALTGTVVTDTGTKWEGTDSLRADTAGAYAQWTLLTTRGTGYYIRDYLRLDGLPGGSQAIFAAFNTGNAICFRISVDNLGRMRIVNNAGSFVGALSTPLTLSGWHIWEVFFRQPTSGNGTIAFRVDGVVVQTDIACAMTNVAINRFRFGRPQNTEVMSPVRHDAIAINDETGAAPNNTWVGGTVPPEPPGTPAPIRPSTNRRPVNPVGFWETNNVQLRHSADRLALRFVADSAFTLHRFITTFALDGVYTDGSNVQAPSQILSPVLDKRTLNASAPPPPSDLPAGWTPNASNTRLLYAHGDGGQMKASLVPCLPNGEPDLTTVLATETVNAVDRYNQAATYFGLVGANNMFLYFDLPYGPLVPDKLYAVVVQNVAADPFMDYCSMNFPVTSLAAAGPHAANTLSKMATGAMAGLDPRECMMWTANSGVNWYTGQLVGGDVSDGVVSSHSPEISFYYIGTGDSAVKLPWFGYEESPGGKPNRKGIQPYVNYSSQGANALTLRNVSRAETLTEAGGFSPTGTNVGVVTVTNAHTGLSGTTPSLGSGLVKGTLTPPVDVAAGERLVLSCSGQVARAEADFHAVTVFDLGVASGQFPITTASFDADMAQLFALPWPYFEQPSESLSLELSVVIAGVASFAAAMRSDARLAAALAGTGALSANGQFPARLSAALSGAGALAANGQFAARLAAALSGAGALAANGQFRTNLSVPMIGGGTMTANARYDARLAAVLAGLSTLTADAQFDTRLAATLESFGSLGVPALQLSLEYVHLPEPLGGVVVATSQDGDVVVIDSNGVVLAAATAGLIQEVISGGD